MGGRTAGYWVSSNPHSVPHQAVVKVDGTTGDEIWRYQEHPPDATTFGSGNAGVSVVFGIAVDVDDSVVWVGQTIGSLVSSETSTDDSDFYVTRLDGADGSDLWTIQGGGSTSFDSLRDVKIDPAGDIIAVGVGGDEDAMDLIVIKVDGTTGTVLWEYSPSTSYTHDTLAAMDVDAAGDVYAAGGFDADNLQGHIAETPVVLKLDGASGDVIWTYEGTTASRAVFSEVTVDPVTGWVVAAGSTEGTWLTGSTQGSYDFAAVLLDADGNELSRYQDGTAGGDYLACAGFDTAGGLFVGGVWTVDGHDEFVAIKFAPFGETATPSPLGDTFPPSSVGRGLPTPAPTSAVAEDAVLAEWEIGAIAGAGALLLLLLGLCECSAVQSARLVNHWYGCGPFRGGRLRRCGREALRSRPELQRQYPSRVVLRLTTCLGRARGKRKFSQGLCGMSCTVDIVAPSLPPYLTWPEERHMGTKSTSHCFL